MPKPFTKAHSRITTKRSPWKKWVPIFVLFLISSVLLTQTLYCYFNAQNFPVDASDLVRTRYDPTLSSNPVEVYSIPSFLPCHVNSKISCEITLASLEEVGVKWTVVSYLTDNGTSLDNQQIVLFPINKINDLIVTLNGQALNPFISNVTGTQSYAVNGYNLTDTTQVETLVISFTIERAISYNRFVKIPWIFSKNYAQFIMFPACNVPIGENTTSNVSTFKIEFELPFRQLLTSESGWVDDFDLPRPYWVFVNSSAYYEIFIEYPINQTVVTNGNIYYFKTNFSEQNVANSYMVSVIPSFNTILLLLTFIASPFYISAIEYSQNKYEKRNQKESDERINTKGYFHLVFLAIKAYCIPIIGFIASIIGGIGQLLPFLSYLLGIMNLVWVPFVLCYPIISYIVLRKTILKT